MIQREPNCAGDGQPVELTTLVGLVLNFEILAKALSAELKPEMTRRRTVHLPQIVSSGPGFTCGYWDFLAHNGEYLHVDRELRLLITAPADTPVIARLRFQASPSEASPERSR